jgi:hypothetical protein
MQGCLSRNRGGSHGSTELAEVSEPYQSMSPPFTARAYDACVAALRTYSSIVSEIKRDQPKGLLDLPDVDEGALWKMVRRESLLALIPFVLLAGGSFVALHRLPEGKAFVLESRGAGVFYDFMSALVLFIFFGFIYMAPSLWVRRSISIAYRLTFFLVFTVGLCWVESKKYIAVVQNPQSMVFVRRFPFGSRRISAGNITSISVRKTSAVAALSVTASTWGGVGTETLDCQRVWLKDRRTVQIMDELADELREAQVTPHKAVAPATGARAAPTAR